MLPPYVEGPPIDFGPPRKVPLVPPRYTLADLLDALIKERKQNLFDLETGPFTALGGFDHLIDFHQENDQDALQALLGTQGCGFEMRGRVMVIYDKKLRALGEQYPLNRTISSLKLTRVSVKECFDAIGRNIHARINGGFGMDSGMDYGVLSTPQHLFSVELSNITLREALYKIVAEYGCQTWNAHTYTIGDKTFVTIYIL